MGLAVIIGVSTPCFVLSLLIVVTVFRPSAAPALAQVLRAVAEPIRALRHGTPEPGTVPEKIDDGSGTVTA